MPESWGEPSPGPSPNYPDFLDDAIMEEPESVYDDDIEGDETKLVRSASMGRRGKPALVMNKGVSGPVPVNGGGSGSSSGSGSRSGSGSSSNNDEDANRPGPTPVQDRSFNDGTGYLEASTSSSNTLPTKAKLAGGLSPEAMLGAFAAAGSTDPSDRSRGSPSQTYSRLSAIRRPPKLDMEAVTTMQSRGSMTSLPDLIRRATRLASMIDKGRRPASRFDDYDDYPDEKFGRDGDRDLSSKFRSLFMLSSGELLP